MREAIREVKDQRARLLRHLGVRKLECGRMQQALQS